MSQPKVRKKRVLLPRTQTPARASRLPQAFNKTLEVKQRKTKRVTHINANFGCACCAREWSVMDLNPEHKVVKCPVCAFPNDIRKAARRAA